MKKEIRTNIKLQQKLQHIGELETKYGIVGISCGVQDGKTLLTEEAADYVILAIKTGIKHLQNIDQIPLSAMAA